jgi:hypothetical protein
MVQFSEDFVGGFFGFGRTYGGSVRFERDGGRRPNLPWQQPAAGLVLSCPGGAGRVSFLR